MNSSGSKADPGIRGVLLDLDGTLYVGDEALPGAVEAVHALVERGIARLYLTNTTRRPRRVLAESLRRQGFPVEEEEIFTAPVAAARWLAGQGIRRIALYVPEAAHEDFTAFERSAEAPEALVVGDLGEEWSFPLMNRAFRQLMAGAQLVALQKNRYWLKPDGLTLDAGPFVAALEYASGRQAVVIGKPTPEFFHLAADSLAVERGEVLLVGDDVEADVGGAQAAGLRAALVRTGKFRDDVLRASGVRPDLILDSVADLPGWLARSSS